MRVAVDARELCGRPTGVGRYLGELLSEWAGSDDGRRHEWVLYAHGLPSVPPAFQGSIQVLPGTGGTFWEQWTLARALAASRPDVLFAPGYSAPLTAPCPTVVAIHDVSFAARPEWFTPREGARRRAITRWSARRARRILTISAFSRDEIVTRLGAPRERVRVTYLGVRRPASPDPAAREPLILYVGSIFMRRHVDALVDAFIKHVAPHVKDARLEIVGENRLPPHARFEHALSTAPSEVQGRVRFRDYVDEPTLQDLYRRASVFAFLSEYEGFGLTPLEALAQGVPVVVLDTTVAREIYGPAACYVPAGPALRDDLGQSLRRLVTDTGARERLLSEAAGVLARYDWAQTAAETLATLEEAAGAR